MIDERARSGVGRGRRDRDTRWGGKWLIGKSELLAAAAAAGAAKRLLLLLLGRLSGCSLLAAAAEMKAIMETKTRGSRGRTDSTEGWTKLGIEAEAASYYPGSCGESEGVRLKL